jgi:glycosyltransferase involved in cell wall biosynthesis
VKSLERGQPKINTLLAVPWDIDRGGVTSVLDNLARYLRTHGHDALFFHPGGNIRLKDTVTKLGFPGVQLRLNMPLGQKRGRILRAVAFPFLFAASIAQLGWLVRKRHIRIINVHYPEDYFFYFAVCRYLFPIRLVTSVHGNDAFDNFGRPKDRYSRAFRFVLHSSDLVVVPSNTYRKRLVELFPSLGNKAISIHNGVNPAQFDLEDRKNGTNRLDYILCVAEHRPYKALDILLHAVKLLLATHQSVRLVLAGDGPLRGELEWLASSLGIRENTEFLGSREPREIARLLHGCDIFVLPSRADNCPMSILEAMVCKKPIVAAAVGGIPELIEHEVSGILVEPENPQALAEGLRHVLENYQLKTALAENAYSRAMGRFCFTHTGAAYEKAFGALLN